MNSPTFDSVILGQGLAGSLLAWRLLQQGQRVLVLDEAANSSSSQVAAGLINPVIGKRLTLHAEVPEALGQALSLYRQFEQDFHQTVYHPRTMLRLLADAQEEDIWHKRREDPRYQDYLAEELSDGCEWGLTAGRGVVQHDCAYLDTGTLLRVLRQWLEQQGAYRAVRVDYSRIEVGGGVRLGEISAQRLVFCEGWQGRDNPWFQTLPWQLSQGEIITLAIAGPPITAIINGRYWLLPLVDGRYRMGASYTQTLDLKTRSATRAEMLAYLRTLLGEECAIEVLQQEAGIRPNTLDKQPFIGQHPEYPELWCFNGFGSRGSLLIPYYLQHLLAALQHGIAVPAAVDVQRVWG